MTYSALFAGIDGAGQGLEAAGLCPLHLFEKEADLAAMGQANTSGRYIVADVRDVDWGEFLAPDVLWMSPVCTRASKSNPTASESPLDLDCALACVRALTQWKPRVVMLENVWPYAEFESFKTIHTALDRLNYGVDFWALNAADYGVPQTRRRLILVARRDGRRPMRPEPTHAQNPVAGLFGTLEKWVGWYEAIEDLLPDLPDARFAPYQEKQIAELVNTCDLDPASAFIVCGSPNNYGDSVTVRAFDEPMFVVTAQTGGRQCVRAQTKDGRVVSLSPRALARFQTLPDAFVLPPQRRLACQGIGNAVPPRLALCVAQSVLRRL